VLLRQVEGLFTHGSASGLAEGSLLDRFVARRDENAFAIIVSRHGPMVRGVCRRYLRDPNDADDAFQATFLILARKAGSIRSRERLGPWLHRVAYRVAARARREGTRRQPIADGEGRGLSPLEFAESGETSAFVHEEIERLPGKYRDPIVLCHLEGCTHDEAAERLGWPVGTVRGRLSRGRDQLRDRLERRGLGSSAALSGEVVSEALINQTVSSAIRFAAGRSATVVLSAQGAAWTAGGLHMLMMSKVKMASLLMFAAGGLLAAGAAAMGMGQGPSRHDAAELVRGSKPETPASEPPALPQTRSAQERDDDEIARKEAELELLVDDAAFKKRRVAEIEDEARNATIDFENRRHRPPDSSNPQLDVLEQNLRTLAKQAAALRQEFLQGRIEVNRLEREIAALKQKRPARSAIEGTTRPTATDPTRGSNAVETSDLAGAEARIELLETVVESERNRLKASLGLSVVWDDQLANTVFPDDAQKERYWIEHTARAKRHEQRTDELRKQYLSDLTELARLKRELREADRQAGTPPGSDRLPASLEKRLSSIETTLQSILKAVQK
jgi:RNA polymerase sigma factor (sigma-70 family)